MLDPYSPCPCGSGKKFKWCCQPIGIQMERAFRQEEDGQHDAALRTMDEITKEHPDNPEVWGRKAELLYRNGQFDEAETTLQKALEINPTYPFGNLLRGIFRQNEGEIPGALLLFRKAADLYAPEARDFLGSLYARIAECELKMNRPVAARAALKMAAHYLPADDTIRQSLDEIFGDQSRLPAAARKEYTFRSPATATASGRRQVWDRAMTGARGAKLSDAASIFQQLTAEDAQDAAAWYNLGLVRAWLGDNRGSLEALVHYVELETDDTQAADAWTLAEVLRCGQGMEAEANVIEHAVVFQIRNPQALFGFLQQWEQERRLVGVQVNQEQGIVTGVILEKVPSLAGGLASSQTPGLGAYLLLVADHLRLWHTNPEALERVRQDLKQHVGPALSEARAEQGPANFNDMLAEAVSFPIQVEDKDEAQRRFAAQMQNFFEEKWIHRPLRSLNLIPPIDAAGHRTLRKKLLGVVNFLDQCAGGGQTQVYDFDRLRRKLGLLAGAEEPAAQAAAAGPDVGSMGAVELAALQPDTLSDDHLEQAYQAAQKLDARELASRFARSLVARPPRSGRTDSYPWYAHLVQQAQGEGDNDSALNYLNEGEKADCEHNEGRRRNDYELRRAQLHVRRGDTDEAQTIFERLIDRAPAELRFRGSAAEAMLSARQGVRALRFAEQGLAKAREKNDRDSEQYFLELVSAARKQTGA